MTLSGQNKTPGTAYRQTECTGCQQGSPKGIPYAYFTTGAGNLHSKTLSFQKFIRKKEVNQNGILYYGNHGGYD